VRLLAVRRATADRFIAAAILAVAIQAADVRVVAAAIAAVAAAIIAETVFPQPLWLTLTEPERHFFIFHNVADGVAHALLRNVVDLRAFESIWLSGCGLN
jgi:hypothetical protein